MEETVILRKVNFAFPKFCVIKSATLILHWSRYFIQLYVQWNKKQERCSRSRFLWVWKDNDIYFMYSWQWNLNCYLKLLPEKYQFKQVNSSVILGFKHFVIRTKQVNMSALKMGGVGSSKMLDKENGMWPKDDYYKIKQMDLELAK